MASRPLVAVTTRPRSAGEVKGWPDVHAAALQHTYVEALWRAGCDEALLFPRHLTAADAEACLARFDGLVLVGGGDVDPTHYGESAVPEVYGIEPASDALELALCQAALRLGTPVLAICRGLQVLNVALGGSLDQHITDRPETVNHGRPGKGHSEHPVDVEPGSLLAKAAGGVTVLERCYSYHHQAVGRLAAGLAVTGRSRDGLIEAVELDGGEQWVVGIQWHAERTAHQDELQQQVFDAFAHAARGLAP